MVVIQEELAEEEEDFFDLRGNVPYPWALVSSAFEYPSVGLAAPLFVL